MTTIAETRLRPPAIPGLVDLLLAAAICGAALLEVSLARPHRLWPDGLLACAATLPLAARRTAPLAATVVVGAALLGQALGGGKASGYTFLLVSVLVALYSLGAHAAGRRRVVGLAVAAAAAVTSALVERGHGPSDAVFALGVVTVPWLVGVVSHRRERTASGLRQRADRLEREQAERERAAVAAERARIARELHDIVAHAVTLMVVQANAGERRLRSDPAAAERSFAVIRESGKGALAELRRMLDLLRDEQAGAEAVLPQPSLESIAGLVDDARAAGAVVGLELSEVGAVPESVAVAAYRLAQEALTNANRHAHGAPVSVQVDRRGDSLRLLVRNGAGGSLDGASGSGYGLLGMRERVAVFGGTLDVRDEPDGGFTVEALLPIAPGT